jgi:hypothetical protein
MEIEDEGGWYDFQVRRDDLRATRMEVATAKALAMPPTGSATLAVDRFGFTANNVTYALMGDALRYWSFFPTGEDGWGRIPVWGFGTVIESAADGLPIGTRVFGYFPMATELFVRTVVVTPTGFQDGSPHRAELPPAYNAYRRVDADPAYDPGREDEQILLRPLYFLAFLLDDFLGEQELFGAGTAIVSSASSKTSLLTAFLLAERGVEVVGLTSPGNREMVEGLGVYDRVLTYDAVDELGDDDAVYVDIAGNADVRGAVHRRLGDRLKHSAIVGVTHWEELAVADPAAVEAPPGPTPTMFFAPDQLRLRLKQWGQDGLDERMAAPWHRLVAWTDGWLTIERGVGPQAVERTYRAVLDGTVPPTVAHVLALPEG